MSLRLVIGRAGSGKSTFCLNDIRSQLSIAPSGDPLVLLVPEQSSFQAEHALVTTPGLAGTIRAQVLSFRRLAYRVLQETGGVTRTPIDEIGRTMLLFHIVEHRRDELKLFRQASTQRGFLARLSEWFTELKRYCISAHTLKYHLDGFEEAELGRPALHTKLAELSMLYADFETTLGRDYIDAEDVMRLLAEKAMQSAYIQSAEVWIDGFHGFTPQELSVIEQLMQVCRRVTITLNADREFGANEPLDELHLFHPPAVTMLRLKQLAERNGIVVEETVKLEPAVHPKYVSAPLLGALEENFPGAAAVYDDAVRRRVQAALQAEAAAAAKPSITLYTAPNRRVEVESAAREMVRLARDEKLRWSDMSVMFRGGDAYYDMIAAIFSDYRIPHFMDRKKSVLHHPLVEFIRSAIEAVRTYWTYDAVFRCVKTDMLLPLEAFTAQAETASAAAMDQLRAEYDELENYVLAFGIEGSGWTREDAWSFRLRRSLEEAQPEELQEAEAQRLARLNELRGAVRGPLLQFKQALDASLSVRDMASAVYSLLESVQAPEKLECWSRYYSSAGMPERSKEHLSVWGGVIAILDQLVEIMGDQKLSLEQFEGMLDTGFESMQLSLVPPSLDQVLVGNMERTKPGRVKHCFVFGLNEGVLPAKLAEEGLLTEEEREQLAAAGIEMAPGMIRKLLDEQFLAYCVLTIPSRRLWISCPMADEEGKSLLPSEWFSKLKELFPHLRAEALTAEPDESAPPEAWLDQLASPERALQLLSGRLRGRLQGMEVHPLWADVYRWFAAEPQQHSALRLIWQSLTFDNREAPLSESTSRLLYGDVIRASISRMEAFTACPFSQFVSHGLRLSDRRIYRLQAPDIGEFYHAAMRRFTDEIGRLGLDWGTLPRIDIDRLAEETVKELAPRLQGEILLSSSRYKYIAGKLQRIVARSAAVLGKHAGRSSFLPVGLELPFGRGGALPPLAIPLGDGTMMEIQGRIDRVDAARGEHGLMLRVIDYKSSARSLPVSEIVHGLSLQLLTYLDVAVSHSQHWLGEPALPAGALYFHVHDPMLTSAQMLGEEAAESKRLKHFKMKGLVLADREAIQAMDQELEKGWSEVIPVGLKADGGFYSNSQVYEREQWSALQQHIRGEYRRVGKQLVSGNVDIRPYRHGKKVPCATCSYKPVCQFDQQFEANDYADLPKLSREDAWSILTQKGGAASGR